MRMLTNDHVCFAVAKKRIVESTFFKLVSTCLDTKSAASLVVKIFGGATIVTALLATLVPTYCILPSLGAEAAKKTTQALLVLAVIFFNQTVRNASAWLLARNREERLMREGKEAFGDDFAAAVQASQESMSYWPPIHRQLSWRLFAGSAAAPWMAG
jgi:hypothetical protein